MEEIIKKRSSAAVRKLMDLRPTVAHVVRGGAEMEVPAESIMVGETIVVRPGDRILTDGDAGRPNVGVGKGAEAGILIRGAEVLERARKLSVVVFDKTGASRAVSPT